MSNGFVIVCAGLEFFGDSFTRIFLTIVGLRGEMNIFMNNFLVWKERLVNELKLERLPQSIKSIIVNSGEVSKLLIDYRVDF